MLSAFTSGIKNFFLSGNSAEVNSRKRRRDENDEVDGEDFGDGLTSSTPKKKLKTHDWSITGMPPTVQQKMSRIIDTQRMTNPCPIIDENEVPSPGEFQQLHRPPIHYQPSQSTLNGTSDCQSNLSGLTVGVTRDPVPDLLRENTVPMNNVGKRLYQTRIPDPQSSTAIASRTYSSSQRREQPSFTRFQPRQSTGVLQHQQNSVFTGQTGGERGSFSSMYQKTFCPLQKANTYNGSLTSRLFSLGEKKRLAEKDTYRELLRQFSNVGFGSRPPAATSTPYIQHHFTDRRTHSHKRTPVRDIPLIVLDDSKADCSINRTPLPASRLHPKVTTRPERSPKLYDFHSLPNGDGVAIEESPVKPPVVSKSETLSPTAFKNSEYLIEDWVKNIKDKYSLSSRERASRIAAEQRRITSLDLEVKAKEREGQLKIQRAIREAERQAAVVEEEQFIEEEEEDDEFPVLSTEIEREIENALVPVPQGEALIQAYRIQITRKDMNTLAGLNWLNDEIINFYMNMLMERGEKDHPKVYAFNTFFYPKLVSSGHASIRRWTRKTDIFAHDYLLIPVHLGMHWCLAVVDFPKKVIQYYDSMGGNNTQCLNAIRQYLGEESLDKRKTEFDMTGWRSELVKDIPEQLNGSDCGMFACKYAEYITRGAPITFTQEHMPYFRRRMVYEILKKQLL